MGFRASVPVLTFVSCCGRHLYECQNQRDTSKYWFSSVALTLTFLRRGRLKTERNVRVATLVLRTMCSAILSKQKGPGKTGALVAFNAGMKSARIEFDDQMRLHLHRERYVRQRRDADELRGHLAVIDLQIVRHVALGKLARFKHMRQLLGRFLHLDEVADLQLVARDVDLAAVHLDVAVVDELAGGKHGGDELGAEDHRIETALEKTDQVFTGVALHPAGLDVDAVELAFADVGV